MIPDVQVRPGDATDHLDWIAQDIIRRKPDVIVCIGDFYDLPSLSKYSPAGSLEKENSRVIDDIDAGDAAMSRLTYPIWQEVNRIRDNKKKQWKPRMVFTFGNHEARADRFASEDARFQGLVGTGLISVESYGFERVPFEQPIEIDGVWYCHYWKNANSPKPIGGTIDNRLNKLGFSFVQGHEQGKRYGNRPLPNGRTIHGIVAGSCLTPDHKVLTADLRYVPLGDIKAGDQLISFDEEAPQDGKRSRRYKTGTVEAVRLDEDEVFAVTLSTGKVFKVTADHQWLVRKGGTGASWLRTDQLKPLGAHPNGKTHVPILMDEWETGESFEHGWLSGLYDGEGCLYARETTGGCSMQLTVHQKRGYVFDRACDWMKRVFGLELLAHTAQKRDVAGLTIKGGRRGIARVLGTLRPVRLLAKFKPEFLSRIHMKEFAHVVSVEPIGRQQIVRIAIDAKTMVVEGYGHHNCYLGVEGYRGPQGSNEWRGTVVLHDVRNGGDFEPMFLTLRYLCQEYTGENLPDYMRKRYPDRDWSHLS